MNIATIKKYIFALIFSIFLFSVASISANTSSTQEYINILEQTNQQLSFFWTPINTILVILATLVAFLTIIFTAIVFFQGAEFNKKIKINERDYREKLDLFLKKYSEYFQKIIKEMDDDVKASKEKLNQIIIAYEEELELIKKGPEEQKTKIAEIEKKLEKLNEQKDLLDIHSSRMTVTPEILGFGPQGLQGTVSYCAKALHKCTSCGYGFLVNDDGPYSPVLYVGGPRTVACPKCKNVDQL